MNYHIHKNLVHSAVFIGLCLIILVSPRVSAQEEIGPEMVWNEPGIPFEDWQKCYLSQGDVVECVTNLMSMHGATSKAIEFARGMNGEAFLGDFDEMGQVDLGLLIYPSRANGNFQPVMLNGQPPIVWVEEHGGDVDITSDQYFPELARRSTNLWIWPSDSAFLTMQELPVGGQRFVFRIPLYNGCHACGLVGYALVAFDFDALGQFLGTTLLMLHDPETNPIIPLPTALSPTSPLPTSIPTERTIIPTQKPEPRPTPARPTKSPEIEKPLLVSTGFSYPFNWINVFLTLERRIDSRPAARYVRTIGEKSGYYAPDLDNQSASAVLEQLNDATIFYFIGHGGTDAAGFSGIEFWDGGKGSILLGGSTGPDNYKGINLSYVGRLPDDSSLRLVVINGCETGANVKVENNLLRSFWDKGADMVLGWNSSVLVQSAYHWGKTFWDELKDGKAVREAAKRAAIQEEKHWWHLEEYRISLQKLVILPTNGPDLIIIPPPPKNFP